MKKSAVLWYTSEVNFHKPKTNSESSDVPPSPEEIVRRSIRDRRSTWKMWLVRIMAGMGIWATAGSLPGGVGENAPIPYKIKLATATTAFVLVAFYDGRRRRFTEQELIELSQEEGKLEETLKKIEEQNPGNEELREQVDAIRWRFNPNL